MWNEECKKAKDLLKYHLTSLPILTYADYTSPFILQTDASSIGLGAVLSQMQNGQEHVIACASRGLTPAESRYPAHKLEFLALNGLLRTNSMIIYLATSFQS